MTRLEFAADLLPIRDLSWVSCSRMKPQKLETCFFLSSSSRSVSSGKAPTTPAASLTTPSLRCARRSSPRTTAARGRSSFPRPTPGPRLGSIGTSSSQTRSGNHSRISSTSGSWVSGGSGFLNNFSDHFLGSVPAYSLLGLLFQAGKSFSGVLGRIRLEANFFRQLWS